MASSFWAVARRPRWIAALVLALAVAGGFAALGQWQLDRSFDNAQVEDGPDTEAAVPLSSIAEPQTAVNSDQLGRRVTVSGEFVAGDYLVVLDRNNGGEQHGAVLVGHLVTDEGATLAVAIGWAPTAEAIVRDAAGGSLTGRYLPSESPTDSDVESGIRSVISVAELINLWPDAVPAYGGYLVLDDPPAGLEPIYSPPPDREVSLNALNVFYAIEWAIFAGFAFYLWYRLVRDVVEREAEHPADGATVD
ncbi:MAG: SURF1 family protein [Microbacteriaceae bacterium]|nr:SURF1 family protein [Microbacteriaceae bacterium]